MKSIRTVATLLSIVGLTSAALMPITTKAGATQFVRVSGTVRDAAGNPIAGASVGLVQTSCPLYDSMCRLFEYSVSAATDSAGGYEFWVNPGSDQTVSAHALFDRADGSYRTLAHNWPGAVSAAPCELAVSTKSPVVLNPGPVSCLHIASPHLDLSAPASVDFTFASPAPTSTTTLTVNDARTGDPVSGARVAVRRTDGYGTVLERQLPDGRMQTDITGPESCGTDGDGRCDVHGIIGTSTGYSVSFSESQPGHPSISASAAGSLYFVSDASATTVSLPLPDTSTLVRFAGRILDAHGEPVANATIGVTKAPQQYASSYAASSPDGTYEVWNWPASSYRLTVTYWSREYMAASPSGEEPVLGVDVVHQIQTSPLESGGSDLDFSFRDAAVAAVTVRTPTGSPLASAHVSLPAIPLAGALPNGVGFTENIWSYLDFHPDQNVVPQHNCYTDQTGTCLVLGLLGSSASGWVAYSTAPGPEYQVLPANRSTPMSVPFVAVHQYVDVTVDPQLPDTSGLLAISGTVRDADGNPITDITVHAECVPSCSPGSATTRSGSDGTYKLWVQPGQKHIISVGYENGWMSRCRSTTGCQNTASVELVDHQVVDFSLDRAISTVTSRFLSAEGVPLDVSPTFSVPQASRTVQRRHVAADGSIHYDSVPSFDRPGEIERHAFFEGTPVTVRGCHVIALPARPSTEVCGESRVTVTDPTHLVEVRLPVSARQSMGLVPGTVFIKTPEGTSLSNVSVTDAANLGVSEVPAVGKLAYTVSNVPIGGSIDVLVMLPSGSNVQALFKATESGYVDVTSQIATIKGDDVTLHITDGGLGDEDGVANGVIVDPVVPVRLTTTTLQVGRTTSVFGQPNSVTARVTAGRGAVTTGSVRFSDGETTLGTVEVRAGRAKFALPASLASGAHHLRAEYLGSDPLPPSTSPTIDVTIVPAITRMALRGPARAAPGTPIVLVAQLRTRGPGRGVPAGDVTFNDGDTELGTATIDGYGNATLTVTLPAGSHTVSATFGGSNNHLGANSARTISVL